MCSNILIQGNTRPARFSGSKQYWVSDYTCDYLDLTILGTVADWTSNAKIAGMTEDLALTGNKYPWLLTIFYISYTVFEFQALMWKIMKPHRWATIVVFSWYAPTRTPCPAPQHTHQVIQGSSRNMSSSNKELAGNDGTTIPNGRI